MPSFQPNIIHLKRAVTVAVTVSICMAVLLIVQPWPEDAPKRKDQTGTHESAMVVADNKVRAEHRHHSATQVAEPPPPAQVPAKPKITAAAKTVDDNDDTARSDTAKEGAIKAEPAKNAVVKAETSIALTLPRASLIAAPALPERKQAKAAQQDKAEKDKKNDVATT